LPVIKRSHPEKQCLLPAAGDKIAKIKPVHSPGLLSDSSGGDVLFPKIYPHIGSYKVCGFEFFKDYVITFLKMTKVVILKNQNHRRARFGYVFGKRATPEL
jgi:hypothetical protein